MTATNGQTGTAESTGTVQVAPPPFHVPAGSACVEDCDDAPLGWSTLAAGAANLPNGAQGGGGDMIGCWQVARSTDPNGDSATSAEEEIMQLYVSADGAGGNENLWFRVRDDGSFSSWTSLRSPQATTTDVKNASNVDKYVPPDLIRYSPATAVAWGFMSSDGSLLSSWQCSGSRSGSSRNYIYNISLANSLSAECVPICTPFGAGSPDILITARTLGGFSARFDGGKDQDFTFVVFGAL